MIKRLIQGVMFIAMLLGMFIACTVCVVWFPICIFIWLFTGRDGLELSMAPVSFVIKNLDPFD